MRLGDRISVLRLGRLVGSIDKHELATMTEQQVTERVVDLMFGKNGQAGRGASGWKTRQLGAIKPAGSNGARRLAAAPRRDHGGATRRMRRARISFDLWPGEVLGIAGIDGNGQKHLAEVLAGQRAVISGLILFRDEEVTRGGVARATATRHRLYHR